LKEKFGGEIPKIDLYQADLTDRSSIDKIFEAYESKGKIWGVIHLAVSPGGLLRGTRGEAAADFERGSVGLESCWRIERVALAIL
jgi:hypothetical protein